MGLFDKFKNKKYNNIEINDEQFGKIIIKHDTGKGIYEGKIENDVDFGGELLDVYIWSKDDNNIEKIISDFKTFCNKAILLKNRIYPDFTNFLKENGVYDEEGNEIEVTEQFLRENLIFNHVELGDVVGRGKISLSGEWNSDGVLFGCSMCYDIAKDEFKYGINWA